MPQPLTAAPLLSVALPCFNERDILESLQARLEAVLQRCAGSDYEIVYVDDASTDGSAELLDCLATRDPHVRVFHLSRNFGHQAALRAGLERARGRAVVLMDCDLQDPPEVIESFLDHWRDGCEVVFGVRRRRKEALPKRVAYSLFYRSLRAIATVDVPLDAGDFCLMDRAVVDAVVSCPERQPFLRGLRSWVGYRQVGVEYERERRYAGDPKYTLRALVRLALAGYLGFSVAPLRIAVLLGLATSSLGFALAVWAVATRLFGIAAPWGWASTIAVTLFLGGVQLFVLGVIGEYLGRVYDETRRRPTYIVRRPSDPEGGGGR